MKKNYKRIAKGKRAFKTDYPNGTTVDAEVIKDYSEAEELRISELYLSTTNPKEILPLLDKYAILFPPDWLRFMKFVVSRPVRDERYLLSTVLKDHPEIQHKSIEGSGLYWNGDAWSLAMFLTANESRLKLGTKGKLEVLKAHGFKYTARDLQRKARSARKYIK
jgi:hypothetical protein